MRRKRIEKSLKAKILSESLKEGCVITQLVRERKSVNILYLLGHKVYFSSEF